MAKLKTKAQQDKATSARLLKTYGISLVEYEELLEAQGGVCAVCFNPPTNRRLHTDHCHKFVKLKVHSKKNLSGEWTSWVEGYDIVRSAPRKSDAIGMVKHLLKRKSIRGLLCAWCNRGLRYYHDDPEILASASRYIKKFHISTKG